MFFPGLLFHLVVTYLLHQPSSSSNTVKHCELLKSACLFSSGGAGTARLQQILAFSPDGSMLASASEKGTIVRVHHLPQVRPPFRDCSAVHALGNG